MQNQSSLPEGWSFEGPDESVGIFGYVFVHEACKAAEYVNGVIENREAMYGKPDSQGYVHQNVSLYCQDCQGTASFVDDVFVGKD